MSRTWLSLRGIMKSRHSRRAVPIQRSQNAFACGERHRIVAGTVRAQLNGGTVNAARVAARAPSHPAGRAAALHCGMRRASSGFARVARSIGSALASRATTRISSATASVDARIASTDSEELRREQAADGQRRHALFAQIKVMGTDRYIEHVCCSHVRGKNVVPLVSRPVLTNLPA
jgi:hypothetical protein